MVWQEATLTVVSLPAGEIVSMLDYSTEEGWERDGRGTMIDREVAAFMRISIFGWEVDKSSVSSNGFLV